jgi:hypothetical protein
MECIIAVHMVMAHLMELPTILFTPKPITVRHSDGMAP